MMVVATAPLVLMFFCAAWAVMMMFVRIFTMAFMMMFVRKFHFFHNFAILLVLYTPEHSVPFSISVAKLRKGFCNLVAKVQIALLMFFFVYAKTNRPNSSKPATKKAVKHFLLNCLIFSVDQLGLEPRTSRLWVCCSNQLSYKSIEFLSNSSAKILDFRQITK